MVFIFQLVCLLFLALAPAASQAADPATFKPQVEIPGMKKEFGAPDKTGGYAIPGSTASIAKYIRVIYKYAIGIVGILAAVVLMIGGVIWITAGGNAERIGEAKAWIASSLTGLLLALLSYTILATVNPALVNLQVSEVKKVEEININKGCCMIGNFCTNILTKEQCEKEEYDRKGIFKGPRFLCSSATYKCILRIATCEDKENFDLCFVDGKSENRGYCWRGTCEFCKKTNISCHMDYSDKKKYKYECCSGECIDKYGTGVYFYCK